MVHTSLKNKVKIDQHKETYSFIVFIKNPYKDSSDFRFNRFREDPKDIVDPIMSPKY